MSNKKPSFFKPQDPIYFNSLLNSSLSETTNRTAKSSHQMLIRHQINSDKLEKDLTELFDILDEVKSTCDLSNKLQTKLNKRNEEISKLQDIVGELQIHLFKEKEQNLKLISENNELKVQDYENKKRIKALLALTGMCERKYMHFVTRSSQDKVFESKLPIKLQKLKELKQKEVFELASFSEDVDSEVLLLTNELLASKLERHMKLSRDEINVLLKEKEVSNEERKIERQRLQSNIDLLTTKLKESQSLLRETAEKLVRVQHSFVKEKTIWKEQKDRYLGTIHLFKDKEGIDVFDILEQCMHSSEKSKTCGGTGSVKEYILSEKEQIYAIYQDQILALEAEVHRLREKAYVCKSNFREKAERMTGQVSYLKNKYEDLNRRRLLEAEGFRTDIRMLRERVKELERKLAKASLSFQQTEQKKLLISARKTLNRAKQLEKELTNMKSKISLLESNETPP